MWFSQVLIVLAVYLNVSYTYKYQYMPVDDEIFAKCQKQRNNQYDMNSLFDFSEWTLEMVGESVIGYGNVTTVWDVQPTDRIQLDFQILHLEKGTWQPTIYSMKVLDFCSVMYNKNQYWYQFWTRNIKHQDVVKSKCINTPGTTLQQNVCNFTSIFESHLKLFGIYKAEIRLSAFNKFQRIRPIKICSEVKGEYIRL
ncbi:uncharacterized protein LOC133836701 [Drosophila sulfurigaster albostrigata]|uniref:uncharacterized protein LOC133836701 n=1 Tax=Drosophila sulfurigaster albostrigata TaxID=89887 RepID=UPI002D21C90E|nr:uncharacterized protein LOC133836701 [Drosophila sulfurigaster albostrigata]